MTEENKNEESKLEKSVKLATEIAKAVPIYQDTIQPSAQEIGKSLTTVTKTVNVALAPIKALVWGYEKIEEFINTRVSEKLQNVPEENITTPKPEVAGPAVEALRYSGHDPNLRELYANLLANAMDTNTLHQAHPGFVEILKNLSSDEAILLQAFLIKDTYPLLDVRAKLVKGGSGYIVVKSNFSHLHSVVKLQRPDLTPSYLDNLCRLGIIAIPALTVIKAPNAYDALKNDVELQSIKKHIELDENRKYEVGEKLVKLTTFGHQFVQNVVKNK
jgi:hypothetical protein